MATQASQFTSDTKGRAEGRVETIEHRLSQLAKRFDSNASGRDDARDRAIEGRVQDFRPLLLVRSNRCECSRRTPTAHDGPLWGRPHREPRGVALIAAVVRGEQHVAVHRRVGHDTLDAGRFEISGEQNSSPCELDV
jgi:hypothetical protein